MSWLLALSAAGAAALLVGMGYGSLSGYAEFKEAQAPYLFMRDLDPAREPRLEEPLLERPYYDYNRHGYLAAEHHPGDDSVTLTYGSRSAAGEYPFAGDPDQGRIHRQTYEPGQTFAYRCVGTGGEKSMHMYHYLGTSSFRGNLSLALVHFELDVPASTPCDYPGFLEGTVGVYDASGLAAEYGLEPYEPGAEYDPYADPVRHAVVATPVSVAAYAPGGPTPAGAIRYDPADGSVTVLHADRGSPGDTHEARYEPGQTFVARCSAAPGSTFLHIFHYRGAAGDGSGGTLLEFANFVAYTRAPVPCDFPGYVERTAGAFDAGALGRQYGPGGPPGAP
ncbi:MAG: hypothetical protein MPI95_03180 [Nitrosopumilus sp.]|nr:hypothetical protein [Nitrosopumilus sp.]MDA7958079.1 hypothetical protein [Nitrosopumilus sp.]